MVHSLPLSQQKAGRKYRIQDIQGDPFRVARLHELGFIRGEIVLFKSKIIFGEPFIVEVCGSQIALRKSEADCLQVSDEE
jgi:Fe2+ transport system protein FeoA